MGAHFVAVNKMISPLVICKYLEQAKKIAVGWSMSQRRLAPSRTMPGCFSKTHLDQALRESGKYGAEGEAKVFA